MKLNAARAITIAALTWAVAGSISCKGDDLTPPGPAVAAIAELSGNGQVGRVGEQLSNPILVRLTDASNNPVKGARVRFIVTPASPGASVSPETATSGSSGEALTRWTLPTVAGTATIVAEVVGTSGLTVQFSATAAAIEPDTVAIMGGQDQAAPPLAQLPESLKVKVTDRYGNPVSGFRVTWASVGEGSISPVEAPSDAEGYAAAARTLGGGGPTSSSTATASGLKGSPLTFTHRVVQPATVVILTQPSSTAGMGTPFAQQPVIEVRDAAGTVLDRIQVVASVESGGGILNGTTTAVTSGGSASFENLALSGALGAQVLRFTSGSAFALSSPITVTAPSGGSQGQWSAPVPMPLVGIHMSLLPNGKVMMFSRTSQPYLWDPSGAGTFTQMPLITNVFCSGHTLLPDGRLFVIGGHIAEDKGLPDGNIFDPVGNSWTRVPNMLVGRWYPTATVLPNGEVLVLGGRDELAEYSTVPEIWTGSGWRQLTGTGVARPMPYYPRMFVAPNGKTFFAGPWQSTRYFDQTGNGRWEPVIPRVIDRNRTYGSAVMYEPGKIIYIGGADPPENTAEIVDLNQPSPTWSMTGSMAFQRRHHNATVLPDGQVLVTGGSSAPGFNNETGAVHTSEMWNPATGAWAIMAPNAIDRVYHGTTLLLPDGRVLFAGSGEGGGGVDQKTYEIYSPPYLFKGPRPTIASAPASVAYGQIFQIQTPNAGSIQKVSIIRLGSVTHAFDESQRFMSLTHSASGDQLSVSAPLNANLAQPGHYLLSIVDSNGVPSVSKVLQIR